MRQKNTQLQQSYSAYLNKDWDNTLGPDQSSVVRFSGENVKSSDSAFNDFFHAHAVSVNWWR